MSGPPDYSRLRFLGANHKAVMAAMHAYWGPEDLPTVARQQREVRDFARALHAAVQSVLGDEQEAAQAETRVHRASGKAAFTYPKDQTKEHAETIKQQAETIERLKIQLFNHKFYRDAMAPLEEEAQALLTQHRRPGLGSPYLRLLMDWVEELLKDFKSQKKEYKMNGLLDEIKDIKNKINHLEYQRRKEFGGVIAHDYMTLSELYYSLKKNLIYGEYNDKFAKVSDNLKVYICKIYKLPDGRVIQPSESHDGSIVFNYNGMEFVKNSLECMCCYDIFLLDFIKVNRWY